MPVAELASVAPGVAGGELTIPGAGARPATGVSLQDPPGATLILARSGPDGLSREEASLLRGMARVTSMTMRMLRLLGEERAAREEADHHAAENARLLTTLMERQALLERLAEEQAALRRVATLVAGQSAAEDIFAAVAEEASRLLRADGGFVCRYEPDRSMTVMARRIEEGGRAPVGMRIGLEGGGVADQVLGSAGAARLDSYEGVAGPAAELARKLGMRSGVASPIIVEGRLWGAMVVLHREPLPPDSEERTANFTELIATAIANAEGRAQLAASRARVLATADETRRRIERDLHDGAQQRLVSVALKLRLAQSAVPPPFSNLQAQIGSVADELDGVQNDLHEIASGIHPAILSKGGLAPALKTLVRRSPVPVELKVCADGRLPERVEVAAYYVVAEALTNVAKHAEASITHIDVRSRDGVLELCVLDDGLGGADLASGSGLLGLADRIEALGGTMRVLSPKGKGTSLLVTLPVAQR
ncbi:MAG: GAF domain-containing sensor histidine kinase [Acidimicrobiales bacterium]